MKAQLFFSFVLIFLSQFQNGSPSAETEFLNGISVDSETQEMMVKSIVENVFGSLAKGMVTPGKALQEDVLSFNAIVDLTNTSLSNFIDGKVNLCNGTVSGLNSIAFDLITEVNGTFNIIVQLRVGELALESQNSGALSLLDMIQIGTYGDFLFELKDMSLDLTLYTVVSPNSINVTKVSIDVSIGKIGITAEDTTWNDSSDWDIIFEFIATIWPSLNPVVENLVLDLVGPPFLNCSLLDLLGGKYECLGLGGGGGIDLPIEIVDDLTCPDRPVTTVAPERPPDNQGASVYGNIVLASAIILLSKIF